MCGYSFLCTEFTNKLCSTIQKRFSNTELPTLFLIFKFYLKIWTKELFSDSGRHEMKQIKWCYQKRLLTKEQKSRLSFGSSEGQNVNSLTSAAFSSGKPALCTKDIVFLQVVFCTKKNHSLIKFLSDSWWGEYRKRNEDLSFLIINS